MDRTIYQFMSEAPAAIAKPQKAFAAAFAVMALALAGCASGLGANPDRLTVSAISRVDEGTVVGAVDGHMLGAKASEKQGFAYTVRLRTGELVNITQGGDLAIANGTPVLVEYGERARVIPQNASIGY